MNYIDLAYNAGKITEYEKSLLYEYNQRLISNGVPVIYDLRHLRKLLNIRKTAQDRLFGAHKADSYRSFYIPKKSGGVRHIEAPSDELKFIQLWIKENILDKFCVSEYAKGFVKGVSIYDNAACHTEKELIINIDLKDFFPSIKYNQVYRLFKYIGYTDSVSKLLTCLCTNSNNVLPQGSPASPVISNLVSLKLDRRLGNFAKSIGADYSRYADDITFSGNCNLKKYIKIIKKIIREEGYTINNNKYRMSYNYQRQEVTGLIVNDKVSVPKRYINEIENAIYYCKKYGVKSHLEYINCEKGFYKEHLYGIAYFIKMVDKQKGEQYIKKLNEIIWFY